MTRSSVTNLLGPSPKDFGEGGVGFQEESESYSVVDVGWWRI